MGDTTPTYHYLHTDYDIIQAIRSLIKQLPISVDIFHVKSHQDRNKPFQELSPYAKANVLADHHATAIHALPPLNTGLFPTWLLGTRAVLLHNSKQITSQLSQYIRIATHTPAMKEYLINHSHTATGRDSTWDDSTYDSIAWKHLGEALRKYTHGQQLQLSKYMNDMLPTLRRLQTFDNKTDGCCFACGQLWEDTNHVLQCPTEDRCNA